MNNGRMTFRFDVEKDKQDRIERWTGSTLQQPKEYDPPEPYLEDIPQDPYQSYADLQDFQDDEDIEFTSLHTEQVREINFYEEVPPVEEIYNGAYHSRRPFYGWKFAVSVTAALGIGLLFGYIALSFFKGEDLPVAPVTQASNHEAAGEQNTEAVLDPAGIGTSGELITIPVQIPAQSYYLLQYGVFSTPKGASQAQQELLTAGLAAGLDPSDGNRVYAGISPDREQAKLLSNDLKSQGIELYVREVTIPATEELNYSGAAETVNHYFEVSGRILAQLSTLSASLLSNGTSVISDDVSSLHMEWTEAAKSLTGGSSPTALRIIDEQEKTINQGISALNEYNKNKSDGLLWEVQGAMMEFLTTQKDLLTSLISEVGTN
ncbi:MAG: SPOR domain-containing protein [Paenibacillus sp.]|nr:SPOR domain-containing protein [Paenibacillus sp.]